MKKILIVCTTDSMIWNFLVPHIRELEKLGYYVECASSITGKFFEDLKINYGIKMNEIPFERSPYKVSNIFAYKRLCRLITEKNFDLVFCHEPVGGAIGRLSGKKCKCKVIYMAHGFHFYKGAPKSRLLYYIIEKYLSRFTDTIITINEEDYKASLSFDSKYKYKINGIGIDTSKFMKNEKDKMYLNEQYNLSEKCIKVLAVGELIPRKNHKTVIEALSKLNNPNVYFFIAGEGDLKKKLYESSKALGVEKQVFLLGYRKDISRLCNSADIFIMPSIHEGLSVALMEAMGCGKAIIASKIRGNTDLVHDNKGGYLVSTFEVNEYVNAINKLLVDDVRLRFGNYNEKIVKQYDIEIVKKQLIDIIRNYN